jgi:hypothetical protein
MSDDRAAPEQRDKFEQAVRRKSDEARQASLEEASRPPEELDPRAKSSGHKKKTADKWNQ